MSTTRSRIGFIAYSLTPGTGGIPRVARLIERTLAEMQADGELTYQCRAFDQLLWGQNRWSRGVAQMRMLLVHRQLARNCDGWVYDSCQMAQLHQRPWPLRTPALTFLHGIEIWEQAKPRWLSACHASSLLAANSDYTRQRAQRLHGNFDRAHVSWLATEQEQPPPESPIPSVPTVLIVSRIDRAEGYKGHLELLDAWPKVIQAVPNARLRIVGRGSGLDELKQLAARLPCAAQIIFEGFVPDERLEQMYADATLFAMPSRGEGFGIVYVEAMRCALPVIVSKHDAGQEVIEHGRTGYAVDLDQPTELVDRLIELLSQPQLARTMGLAGQRRWQEHFTLSRFVQRFRPIVQQLLRLSAKNTH